MIVREATEADGPVIAALHALSWRTAYRGILRDAYLDGPVEADRSAMWRERFADPAAGRTVLVACEGPALLGFVCLLAGADARWGALVDNLHVDPARKRGGLGRRLLREAAGRLPPASVDAPIHLFVLEENRAARAFYERLGGAVVERRRKREPDGGEPVVLRYVWSSPGHLARDAGLDRSGCLPLQADGRREGAPRVSSPAGPGRSGRAAPRASG